MSAAPPPSHPEFVPEAEDLLVALQAEVGERALVPDPGDPRSLAHVEGAIEIFVLMYGGHRHLCEAARDIAAPLAAAAARDAAALRELMQDDPAGAGLEGRYRRVCSELSLLATLFAVGVGVASPAEDTRARLAAELKSLMGAAASARPAWRFIRRSFAAGRGIPPPRARPRPPVADDAEYYAARP